MTHETWATAREKIRAAGRWLPDKEALALWDDFQKLDERYFIRALDTLLMNEDISKVNLIGYFRKQVADLKLLDLKKQQDRFEAGRGPVYEVSPEQHNLFFLCVGWATHVYDGEDYCGWNQVFSAAWDKLSGQRLTGYLQEEAERLAKYAEESPKVQKENKLATLRKAKTNALKRLAEYQASREVPALVTVVAEPEDDFDDSKLPF